METVKRSSPQVFSYQGNNITFFSGKNVMVNATEMSKAFGKRPFDYLKTQSARELIEAVSVTRNIVTADLVKVTKGGDSRQLQGTWLHEDIALDFAQWLSVDFKMWCMDRIKELITHGATAINPDNLLNPDFIIRLATELKHERAENEKLSTIFSLQEKELRKAAPKAEYYDNVLQSESVISVSELANELGFRSAKALNAFLRDKGVIKRVNGTWTMCAKYSGLNYAQYKTYAYFDSEGRRKTSQHLYFTNKGKQFLQNFSLNK